MDRPVAAYFTATLTAAFVGTFVSGLCLLDASAVAQPTSTALAARTLYFPAPIPPAISVDSPAPAPAPIAIPIAPPAAAPVAAPPSVAVPLAIPAAAHIVEQPSPVNVPVHTQSCFAHFFCWLHSLCHRRHGQPVVEVHTAPVPTYAIPGGGPRYAQPGSVPGNVPDGAAPQNNAPQSAVPDHAGPRFAAPNIPAPQPGVPLRPSSMRLALVGNAAEEVPGPYSNPKAEVQFPAPNTAAITPAARDKRPPAVQTAGFVTPAAPAVPTAPTNIISLLFQSKPYSLDDRPPFERIVYVPYAAPDTNSSRYGGNIPISYPYGNGNVADGYWFPNMPVSRYPMPYPMPGVPLPRYAAQGGNVQPGVPQPQPEPSMYPVPPQLDERARFFWYGQ